jgi:hypothetical protein
LPVLYDNVLRYAIVNVGILLRQNSAWAKTEFCPPYEV